MSSLGIARQNLQEAIQSFFNENPNSKIIFNNIKNLPENLKHCLYDVKHFDHDLSNSIQKILINIKGYILSDIANKLMIWSICNNEISIDDKKLCNMVLHMFEFEKISMSFLENKK